MPPAVIDGFALSMIQNPPGTLNSRPSTYKSDLG
jgi:hypothetical protein